MLIARVDNTVIMQDEIIMKNCKIELKIREKCKLKIVMTSRKLKEN